jgi:hypothetical protein
MLLQGLVLRPEKLDVLASLLYHTQYAPQALDACMHVYALCQVAW